MSAFPGSDGQPSGVQIVMELAARVTRLFDEAGASQVERYSALEVARALVPVSLASVSVALSEKEPDR